MSIIALNFQSINNIFICFFAFFFQPLQVSSGLKHATEILWEDFIPGTLYKYAIKCVWAGLITNKMFVKCSIYFTAHEELQNKNLQTDY